MGRATIILLALVSVAFVASRPTKIDAFADLANNIGISSLAQRLCTFKQCLFGDAIFDRYSRFCRCPDMADKLITDPCGDLDCKHPTEPFYSVLERRCYCGTMEQWFDFQNEILEQLQNDEMEKSARVRLNHQGEQEIEQNHLQRRQVPTSSATPIYSAIPTFVPPPKQDITPELLNESLSIQPQNTATISSIIPYFRDNVLQIYMQLMGLVADTLVVNASASLACAGIGLDREPKIAVVPNVVQQGQGQPQVQVADCQCIGVNMYTPNVITYWIQKVSDGTIYSLIGSNTVIDIDKMNTTQSTSLSIVTLPVGSTKRSAAKPLQYVQPERRQIFSIQCDSRCPFYHMHVIKSTDGYCGCIFNGADKEMDISPRGIVAPDINTATMTEAACKAMTCYNNDNKPAVFNPFSLTCWCNTPPVIESNPSAWSPNAGST
ncbi:hypothetical protein LTR96_004236 [Exophiala xenobiotica]|nr:hypothetical protein LTR92_004156 [Exophiala xenobiotica]KAK5259109.1 hypothetical protein LTR40_006608 [Exophiala xenobiotica]KAK5270958.1 hypothetical protein LTR96_004236 [Exophiala xenobiotica]KAK5339849.1 hypothetical protein LTR98_004651 [Exophiala xenobiotica]KAK5364286.1 hypothetical protein LTS13_008900 [Exophiala xenobiotica]